MTLADVQRALGVDAATALRVQAALFDVPALTRDEAARRLRELAQKWQRRARADRDTAMSAFTTGAYDREHYFQTLAGLHQQCADELSATLTALYGPPVETPTPIPGHHKVNYGSAIWETPTPDGAKTCETCKWVFRSRSGTGRTGCDHDALVGSGVGWLPPDFGCTFHERTTLDVEG